MSVARERTPPPRPPSTHTHTLCTPTPARAVTPLVCHRNSQWLRTTVIPAHYPWSLSEGWLLGGQDKRQAVTLEAEEGTGVGRPEWRGPKGRKPYCHVYIHLSVVFVAQNGIFQSDLLHDNTLRLHLRNEPEILVCHVAAVIPRGHNGTRQSICSCQRAGGGGREIVGRWPLTSVRWRRERRRWSEGRRFLFHTPSHIRRSARGVAQVWGAFSVPGRL